jgi:hypothetical protein
MYVAAAFLTATLLIKREDEEIAKKEDIYRVSISIMSSN